jgi:signal transduction histidine kinase
MTLTATRDDVHALRALADAARRVEEAYSELRLGAARLDRELAEANQRLEQKVVQLEHLSGSLAAVLAAIPSGVVVGDVDGTVIMSNPAAQRALGLEAHELLGRRAADVRDAQGGSLLLLQGGECEAIERVIESGSGARCVRGSVVAVRDAAGALLGRVELLDDRTEVKALEAEVHRLDRLAELGRVAAILAHEIRNPLSGIRGFASLLERKLRDSDGREDEHRYARKICQGADRADAIIDSVLFLANPRPLRKDRVELESFLCDCWENVAQADPQRTRGVSVALSVAPPAAAVMADRVRLSQAVCNLLHNAIEAMGGKGRLELAGREHDGAISIVVRDDGPGLDAATAENLFEPFFTTKSEGAGLGLALVQRIARLHGGEVRVENHEQGGAQFTLTLPCPNVSTQQDAKAESA